MADADPITRQIPSPFTINARLRRRVTEAVIAQGGIRHDALNAFLRERLGGTDVGGGALLSDVAVEGAAGFVSSGRTLADLAGSLLHPRLVEALATGAPDYRFDYPAYLHQVEAWEHLRAPDPRSVLVSSGTGSGKTECFLVPLLDDLAREAERKGRLTGVRALMLYPLNALIASQQERLTRWTAPFGGDIRFALYNGLMTDKREGDRARDEARCPEQVLYRRTLRADPPPILVTNNTMLEYLTIRKEDHKIVNDSQGRLRWIVIDEAHSYVGSAAAEVALLLRRVLQTFGVRAADVRFVVRVKAGAFFGYPLLLAEAREADPPVARLIAWLRNPSTATDTAPALHALTRGTALAGDGGLALVAADAFSKAADGFGRQWQALRDQADTVTAPARAGIERQLRRMGAEPLLGELADRSVLPGHGFPTAVVPFVTDCAETQNRRVRDEEGSETARNRRYDYPSRNADVALREYAPGAQVVVDGLVWTSAGVQLNWQRPTAAEGGDRIQSIRWAWTCAECGEAGCEASMPDACSACGTAELERTQFLEPAGFRVEWRSKPHADTNSVDYIEPRPPRISAREARWEPMLDPVLGRARATADGLVFHHSMGAQKAGYRICLDCGRAEEDSDAALADHHALMPPKGGAGRCAGNDKIYAKTRPLALGHEVLTDVAELQPSALDDAGAAWALASALREALARRLGIDPRELGLGVVRRTDALGARTHSLLFHDQSAGGAGYAPQLLADLAGVLKDAAGVLACSADCMRGCSACVLVADLFQQQEVIDRRAALAFATRLLAGMAEPQPEDIAGPGCRLSPPAADAIVRRIGRGDVVALWVGEEVNISALAEPPLVTLFGAIAGAGAEARIVLPERLITTLDDSARAGLRNAAHRHGFSLWTGEPVPAANGARLMATLARADRAIGFLSRDAEAARIGPGWGSGSDCPIVEMPLIVPAMTRVPDETLERAAKPGDRVRMIASDPGRSQRQFGSGLVNAVLRPELEAAGLWRPGRLSSLAYSDRYLKAPLPALLLLRTLAALRDALATKGAAIPLAITTEPLRLDRQAGLPVRLHHDWRDEDARAETIEALAARLNFTLAYSDDQASHGRKLTIRYDDGSGAVLLFDQGFGYWRATSGDRHDFRAGPNAQAKAVLDGATFVSGQGESYVAVTRE